MSSMDDNEKKLILQKPFNIMAVVYTTLLAIICVLAFLLAKYIVERNVDKQDVPIDTSVRM